MLTSQENGGDSGGCMQDFEKVAKKLCVGAGIYLQGLILKGLYAVGRAAVAGRGRQGARDERWTRITVLG